MISETLAIAAAIFGSIYIVATIAYLMFRQYLRARHEELKIEHARLDDFRAHLERQLIELNMRFSSSEERWRELNHLVIAGQRSRENIHDRPFNLQDSEFLRSHGIGSMDLIVREDQLFVLTPFHDEFKDEFDVVVQVGQSLGFKVFRGDEKANKGDIFPHLLRYLVQSRVVIANISGRNPNVFYELGIAHAIDKPVILLAHSKSEVPFDIQSKLIIFYQSDEELRNRLSHTIARTLIANRD